MDGLDTSFGVLFFLLSVLNKIATFITGYFPNVASEEPEVQQEEEESIANTRTRAKSRS